MTGVVPGPGPVALARARKPALPRRALPVPLVNQEESYSCGAAALRAVLSYFGVYSGPERALYELLGTTPEDGTLPESLVKGAERFGLSASVEQFMTIERLRELLISGKLVILELQAWRDPSAERPWRDDWADGHYVVLVGLDDRFAYFMDPSTDGAYTYLPLGELLERWHDENPARKGPRSRRDYQLGIIVSGAGATAPPPRPRDKKPRRLVRLD